KWVIKYRPQDTTTTGRRPLNNGKTVALGTSILTELYERRAAITPDKVVEPDRDVEDGKDNVVKGVFPDHLKQTYTIMCQLVDEYNTVVQQQIAHFSGLDENPISSMKRLFGAENVYGAIEALEAKRDALSGPIKLVEYIFWTDVRR